jgi:uncharacterized protein (TIGR03083 family)
MTNGALVEYETLLHTLGEETERIATAVADAPAGGLDAEVPGCPGLTTREVARHVGSLYRMLWHWLRSDRRPTDWQYDPAPGQGLAEYVRSGAAPLLAELSAHPPSESCPTWWTAESNYGFWYRRMAHEATVHRIDVQGALGQELTEVPAAIALDGVDEVLTLWFVHRLTVLGVHGTHEGTVLVRAGDNEWVTHATTGSTGVRRLWQDRMHLPPGPNTPTVSADPMLMYRWLWGRVPIHSVAWQNADQEIDAIAQLWALLRIATR